MWGGAGRSDRVGTSARSSPTRNGVDRYLPADQCPNRLPNQVCMLPKRKDPPRSGARLYRRRRTSGSPLLHGGLIARDGLRRVDTSTVAVHALEIRVAERSEGRYPPGGVEGKELLEKREGNPQLVNESEGWRTSAGILDPFGTIKRARPCSSMSGTKFSIGLGGRGVKALCGRATSWGQSSAEGTPTTLEG